MSRILYTPEEEAWIVEHYHVGTINDTLAAFEAQFGRRLSKQALFVKAHKLGCKKDTHDHERNLKAQKRMRWSSDELTAEREWMLEHDTGESVYTTIDAFEKEFGVRLTRSQVSLFRSTHGTAKRISHGGGKPVLPVGSERPGKDGYIKVKVKLYPDVPQSKDNWRFKHHVAWEKANGKKLPKSWTVLFADGDKTNYSPDNLVAVPRKYIGQLNNPDLPDYSDRQTLEACIALCDLRMKLRDVENGSERPCKVCGTLFTPTAAQRSYKTPVQTCPECLANGRKWAGKRNAGAENCAICGAAFTKTRSNQQRCPECIAQYPKHCVEAHKRKADKHECK